MESSLKLNMGKKKTFASVNDDEMSIMLTVDVTPLERDLYLAAVNLHGQCPSSISTSKVSHVTVNRNGLLTKHQWEHLTRS